MERQERQILDAKFSRAGRAFSVASLTEAAMLLLAFGTAGIGYAVIRREILSRYHAENYAHEQREWCLATLTSIGDAVIVTDTKGTVVLVNSVAGKLTGWGDEAVGKPLEDVFRIVNETTRRVVDNPVDKVLSEGAIVGLANHTVLIAKNGIDIPIDDSGAPIRNKDGDLTGVVLVFRDITERRAAEAALARSERQFHLIAETIPQMVWMSGPDGRVEYLNQRWLDYIGLLPDKLDGWEWQRIVHPDDLPRALAAWTHALKTGEAFTAEFRLRRADGTYLWHLGQALLLREDGKAIKWFGTCTDFDEQKRTLDALHESEERLKFALSAARMVPWDWDLVTGTAVRSENAPEILGLPSSGAQAFNEFLHPEDRNRVEETMAAAARGDAPYDLEFRIITHDGRLLWIADKARLRRDAAGRPTHLTGISVDITERKRGEQLLLAADRRKNEFLAMLAHELRNPLAPIRSAADVLRLLGPKDDKLKWARDVIERQVQHMTRLVDDLLDISRISRGRITLEKAPVNVASVVAGAMETVRPLTEARKQTVEILMPAEPGRVMGDETRLIQVLANLLHNAVKFTPEGERITLTVSRLAQEGFMTVRDTGIGIPDEMLEHVFDLFTQLDASLERSQGGLGIGLTLVKNLVEMHGGTVQARSEGRGKGSEFTVRLPLLPRWPRWRPLQMMADSLRPRAAACGSW
ncbi:MAG: PAS domain-containing sensor histidine kinase [Gammaproteobacteria bacterium]